MLQFTVNAERAERKLKLLKAVVSEPALEEPIEQSAWIVHREIVLLTPKRWTGDLRRRWMIARPSTTSRIVRNTSKVMLFIERGTGRAGSPTSRGGYIYPKTKRFLFIPLRASAALTGWRKGMRWGVDFILRRRVRGIKARRIIRKYLPRAVKVLKDTCKAFIRRKIK